MSKITNVFLCNILIQYNDSNNITIKQKYTMSTIIIIQYNNNAVHLTKKLYIPVYSYNTNCEIYNYR